MPSINLEDIAAINLEKDLRIAMLVRQNQALAKQIEELRAAMPQPVPKGE